MTLSPFAGKPAPAELLIDVDRLVNEYYTRLPDTSNPQQLVHFGTSGHRGTPEEGTFTEAHILAIAQGSSEVATSLVVSRPDAEKALCSIHDLIIEQKTAEEYFPKEN